jgi:periplasmic protein TonB
MKTKNSSTKSTGMKFLLVASMILMALMVCSINTSAQQTKKVKTETKPPAADKDGMTDGAYQKVDEMPAFPGGDEALLKYIAENTKYPKDAKEKNIQGRVIMRFKVKTDGSVSDVAVMNGVSPSIDAESVRVIGTLPKFTPGKLKGKTVAVWYMVPITFSLK